MWGYRLEILKTVGFSMLLYLTWVLALFCLVLGAPCFGVTFVLLYVTYVWRYFCLTLAIPEMRFPPFYFMWLNSWGYFCLIWVIYVICYCCLTLFCLVLADLLYDLNFVYLIRFTPCFKFTIILYARDALLFARRLQSAIRQQWYIFYTCCLNLASVSLFHMVILRICTLFNHFWFAFYTWFCELQ